jgi:hypothetical protein
VLLQISTEVPMGWARMLIRQSAQTIAEIMRETPQASEESATLDLGANFSDQVNDAFDGLWSE